MLKIQGVFLDQDVKNKKELLALIAAKASEISSVDTHSIYERLFVREKLYTTAIGNQVAMPQANLPFVGDAFGMVVRLQNPVFFDEFARIPVDTVFAFFGVEGQGSKNLMALSQATVAMRNPQIVSTIRKASCENEIVAAFTAVDAVAAQAMVAAA